MDPNLSVAVALGAFFVWALVIWNRLVRLKAAVSAALAQLDAEAQRLRELVPRLEQPARAQLHQERETLAELAEARETAQRATQPATTSTDAFDAGEALSARVAAEDRLAAALNRLLAGVETHPQLKADQSLQQIAGELTITTDRIAALRRSYDHAAVAYNAALQAFPAVMFASTLGFKPAAPLR